MVDKKQSTKKATDDKKKGGKNTAKWTEGTGVPIDPKKVKWAAKY